MKSTKLMLITILCLILSSLSGCKKDIVESLLKNNSYVECIINGKCAPGPFLVEWLEMMIPCRQGKLLPVLHGIMKER